MTVEAFLRWCEGREGRFELVDGVIVAMAGATKRHDRIVGNIYVALATRLRAKPCRPYTADLAVRTQDLRVRRPDVTVDCEAGENDALEADRPTAVFEVLSPSTRQTDLVRKLNEYQGLSSLRHIVLVEQSAASITVYSRASGEDAWKSQDLDGLEGEVDLPAIGVRLPATEIYAEVEFDPDLPPGA
jgi:Uma2 family endonuclease